MQSEARGYRKFLSPIGVGLLLLSLFVGVLLWLSPNKPSPAASEPVVSQNLKNAAPSGSPRFPSGKLPFPTADMTSSASRDTGTAAQRASDELSSLEAELAQMEAKVYAADPLLRSCELYERVLEGWLSETGAQSKSRAFTQGTSDSNLKRRRDRAQETIDNLLGPILMKEFASTPNLAPLARWTLERAHESGASFFAGVDPIIGVEPPTPQVSIANASGADQILAGIDARYPSLLQRAEAVAAEVEMPPEVLEAIRNKRVYGMLMDMSRLYVHLRTPAELRTLRAQVEKARSEVERGASR